MPNSKSIETIQKELQDLLVDDIAAALKNLQELLPPQSELYATVIGLLARLNEANKARLRNTLSNEELNVEYNKIRAAFLEVVHGLKESDFTAESSPAADAKGGPAPRQGSILYRIPDTMPKEKETKCVVRIALSEDAIVEDITIDEHVQLKKLYRVSDTMQAELLDPSGGQKFRITTISDNIQIIDEEGFTEWWFYVTPLVEGQHPLVLKISIIEMINGQPRSKELVMEETIQVVTEGAVVDTEAAAPKQAGVLSFQSTATALAGLVTKAAPPKPAKGAGAKASQTARPPAQATPPAPAAAAPKALAAKLSLLQKIAIGLAVAGTATVGTYLLTTSPGKVDKETKQEIFVDTLNKDAACQRAFEENSPNAYRNYIYEFPEGECREACEQALARLEQETLSRLQSKPERNTLDSFLINFPNCESLEALYAIVEKNPALREEFLPKIMQRWEKCRRMYPDFPKPPESQLPEVLRPDVTLPSVVVSPPSPTSTLPEPEMVFVKGGSFMMGVENGSVNDRLHQVTLRDFFIGKYEVTFEEYDRFCEATNHEKPNDKGWERGRRPVIKVSWYDAVAYCNWLSNQLGYKEAYTITGRNVTFNQDANGFRMPTEAEWEYAAKGGTWKDTSVYSGSNNPSEVAWYTSNSLHQTRPVGHLNPNAIKLYDMSGNVREWCFDVHAPYPAGAVTNPVSKTQSVRRIFRGGYWGSKPNELEVTFRDSYAPAFNDEATGFRLARWK